MKNTILRALALFLVLSSGALHAETIRVGPGGRYPDLAGALERARDGDTIVIAAGTYTSKTAIWVSNKKKLKITGEGRVNLLCSNTDESVMWISGSDGVELSNLHLKHVKPGETVSCSGNVLSIDMCDNVTVKNCEIDGSGATGIYTMGCTNLLVEDNFIHDNTVLAFNITSSGKVTVRKNRIEYNGGLMGAEPVPLAGNLVLNNADFSSVNALLSALMSAAPADPPVGKIARLTATFKKMHDKNTALFSMGEEPARDRLFLRIPGKRPDRFSFLKTGEAVTVFVRIRAASLDSAEIPFCVIHGELIVREK